MSRISDLIEKFINSLIEDGEGAIEIQRNEMANQFNCAPSQINYVLMTRFTTERGYFIESRRGGGGYIKISRVEEDSRDYLIDLLENSIGSCIMKERAFELLDILYKKDLISFYVRNIIKASVDDSTLSVLQKTERDHIRAEIMKAAIVAAISSR